MVKSSKVIRSLSCIAIILLLFSTLPATALAANNQGNGVGNGKQLAADSENSNNEETGNADDENYISEPLQKKEQIKEKVQSMKQNRTLAQEQLRVNRTYYQDQKKAFLGIRKNIRNGTFGDEERGATRAYLTASIDYMIAHLQNIIYNLEQSNSNSTEERIDAIRDQIEELEEEKKAIEDAPEDAEIQEFANSATSVRGVWNNAKKNAALGAGQTVSEKMEESLAKSESLSEVLRNRIETLMENTEDTQELEDLEDKLDKYDDLMEDARKKQEEVRLTYQNENSGPEEIEEANNQLREALGIINEANDLLKEIFNELKEYETEDNNEETGSSSEEDGETGN